MYDPFIPTDVDSFLSPFRVSANFEVLKKARAYGYNFLNDCPVPAHRVKWAHDSDNLAILTQATFAELRMQEAKEKESLDVDMRYAKALPADVLIFSEAKSAEKSYSLNSTASHYRASASTTQTLEDRFSTEPFEVDMSESPDDDSFEL